MEYDYEKVKERANKIADEIIQNGPIAIKMAKRAINEGIDTDLKTGLEIEKMCYSGVVNTLDR